jgi:hypothetical protein
MVIEQSNRGLGAAESSPAPVPALVLVFRVSLNAARGTTPAQIAPMTKAQV